MKATYRSRQVGRTDSGSDQGDGDDGSDGGDGTRASRSGSRGSSTPSRACPGYGSGSRASRRSPPVRHCISISVASSSGWSPSCSWSTSRWPATSPDHARRPALQPRPQLGYRFVVLALAWWLGSPAVALFGAILVGHTGMDRSLGFGLKYPTAFADTHLGRLGRAGPMSPAAPGPRGPRSSRPPEASSRRAASKPSRWPASPSAWGSGSLAVQALRGPGRAPRGRRDGGGARARRALTIRSRDPVPTRRLALRRSLSPIAPSP